MNRVEMTTLSNMSEVRSVVARDDIFSRRIREQWTGQSGRRLDALIAGCGWPEPLQLELDEMEARVTGIDEDPPALRASTSARKDLDSWSLGDLRSVPVPPRAFDIVYVSFLLERIEHPELVLDRLLTGLRPGGLLLLQMRDRTSAYGTYDRLMPSALRRLLWRRFAPDGAVGPLPPCYGQITSREDALLLPDPRAHGDRRRLRHQRTGAARPAGRAGPHRLLAAGDPVQGAVARLPR